MNQMSESSDEFQDVLRHKKNGTNIFKLNAYSIYL